MLIEFDQNTLANMTAALEFVCKSITPDKDTPEMRKQIAEEMIANANREDVPMSIFRMRAPNA